MTLSTLLVDTLADIPACVARALREDIGEGDITAMLIPEQQQAKGEVLCREHAVICGTAWVDEVFRQLDPETTINWLVQDGDQVVLVGFGTFAVKDRAARTGRNPQTGAEIQIKAAKVPGFKAGKALKDAVN